VPSCRPRGEAPFDQAVLEGLVGQDDRPAPYPQGRHRGGQGPIESAELVVHLDPQGLERPLGRVTPGTPGSGGDRLAHQLCQAGGRRDGCRAALPLDGLGDPAGEPLLAVLPKDPAELDHGVRVDHIGRSSSRRRVHPHVQERVAGVSEAAIVGVELERGDPEVEQHPVDAVDPEVVEDLGEGVIDGVDDRDPVAVRSQPMIGPSQRLGVAVDADQPDVGMAGQQCGGVAAEAEGRVDDNGRRNPSDRIEQLENPLKHDGDVPRHRPMLLVAIRHVASVRPRSSGLPMSLSMSLSM
jgi:hypothetical protein